MRRLALSLISLLAVLPLSAYEPEIRDIDVRLDLQPDGTALVTETWDVTVASGTEWYLVRNNLGDIRIGDLSVSDESGRRYTTIGRWDIHAGLEDKAGKCGLNPTSTGCEICWGVGSYGPHTFTVSYSMSNAVKSLDDYDALHLQLVSPGLSARPEHVKVTIGSEKAWIDTTNTRVWGYGFYGNVEFISGKVIYESDRKFERNSSVIALLRFDKGVFSPTSRRDGDFQSVLDEAMEGSSYSDSDDDEPWWMNLGSILFGLLFFWGFFILPIRSAMLAGGIRHGKDRWRMKRLFGRTGFNDLNWNRDIPFGGNIFETFFVASHMKGYDDGQNSFISAFMLRLVQHGVLTMSLDGNNKTECIVNENADRSWMSAEEEEFYHCLLAACGDDKILQVKEFKRWGNSNRSKLTGLVNMVKKKSREDLYADGYAKASNSFETPAFTDQGKLKACEAMGFKKYLEDFTIINQRQSVEVALWQDYLVVASLFGIADKVAKELKEINPTIFAETLGNYGGRTFDFGDIIIFNDTFARSFNTAAAPPRPTFSGGSHGSFGGFGGGTSFGGGGGFSGGGFGGGSR
ncbi:MAG: DUF2207 domain-containing protein [Bacteroidales bacterium]|nr:DUF2207 domain-containing protein [Bacteroidales bacterium]